jgi:hypothetical protein
VVLDKLVAKGKRPGPLEIYFGGLSSDALIKAERVFFTGLQLSNGTFKTTADRRLDDVNELVTTLLLPCDSQLRIMDVAVSSGVSTAEWSDHLLAHGIDHRMTAGDAEPEGVLLHIRRRAAILWQSDGYPLALQLGRRCIYLDRSRRSTRVLRWPLRHLFTLVMSAACQWLGHRWICPVCLVSPRVANHYVIRVIRDDILDPARFTNQFDVCRAANILNREYFPDNQLRLMVRNLRARLRANGLLVVCRSTYRHGTWVNRATILRRVGDRMEVIGRLNGGSEVEDLLIDATTRGSPANQKSCAHQGRPQASGAQRIE